MAGGGRRLALIGAAVAVSGLLVAGVVSRLGGGGYQVTFVFPDAANLIAGSQAQIDGFTAGVVSGLEARDGRARVRVRIGAAHAPLREGATARIAYKSLLGERVVEITQGRVGNAPVPDGAIVTKVVPRVELDQLIQTMDPQTRAAVARLLPELDRTLAGHERSAAATLETAGPAVEALTDILTAIGDDGPALHRLLATARDLAERLVARQQALAGTINGFEQNMTAVARADDALRQGLDELPGALRQAGAALARLPGASRAAVPLLADVRSAAEATPAAAADLRPFLAQLRPALAELRPLLVSLGGLLVETPGALDHTQAAVPGVTSAVAALLPAVDFLRPYTPEFAGAIANLGSATANYDANGHYLRVFVSGGSASAVGSPGTLSPALHSDPHRTPGRLESGAVDAAGSRVR